VTLLPTGTFAGQVALVTGASQGLGRATALALAAEGARLVLVARDERLLRELAQVITIAGGQCIACPADITSEGDARRTVQEAMERFGRIDILLNSAGTAGLGLTWQADPEDWFRVIRVNLFGTFNMTRATLPTMMERGRGQVASITAPMVLKALPGLSAYSASKAGVEQFTQVVAGEVAPYGVRVNAIDPGLVNTGLQRRIRTPATGLVPGMGGRPAQAPHPFGVVRPAAAVAERVLWALRRTDLNGHVISLFDEAARQRDELVSPQVAVASSPSGGGRPHIEKGGVAP